MPGTIVRAEEANRELDAIEVGFDRIDIMANTIQATVSQALVGMFQPQIDALDASQKAEDLRLGDLIRDTATALATDLGQLDASTDQRFSRVITLPDDMVSGNYKIPDGLSHADVVPYIDGNGNANLAPLHDLKTPANWSQIYLGPQTTPPGADLAGKPLKEGALFYNLSEQRLEVYRSGQWVPAYMTGSGVVTVSNVEPGVRDEGDLWFDTQTADLMIWYEDVNSAEWVVVNSNYNALFGPGIGPILSDGSVGMKAPLTLSPDVPTVDQAVSRRYLEWALRNAAGQGGVVAPRITNGVDPRSNFPVDANAPNRPQPRYDVLIGGTCLFFGNGGPLSADYGSIAGLDVQPGDFVISDGGEWNLVRASGFPFGTPPAYNGPSVVVNRNDPGITRDGDMWLDTRNHVFNVAQGGTWVPVSTSGGGVTVSGLPNANAQGDVLVATAAGQNWQATNHIDDGRY